MPLFILFLFLLLSTPSFSQSINKSPLHVCTVGDRRWTIEEEYQYGKWVEENITEDFFIRYHIPVDCADVPYAIRWIYARIAHLPAAATTKDDKWIGHWYTEWKRLPTHPEWHKDVRFRKALFHMLTETTTRTLPLDTYPVRIDPESITPGTAFFITESHSGIIGRIILDGSSIHPLQTWEATSPVKFQKMSERDFLTPRPESTIYSGLVKFRWPVFENRQWKYLPVKEHPYYSLEQYSGSFTEEYADFVEAVAKRIDPIDYPSWDKMEKVLDFTVHYHRAGVPGIRRPLPPLAMYQWDRMTAALADEEPWWEPGRQHGYHVNTFGFLVGELVRRVRGKRSRPSSAASFPTAGPR